MNFNDICFISEINKKVFWKFCSLFEQIMIRLSQTRDLRPENNELNNGSEVAKQLNKRQN